MFFMKTFEWNENPGTFRSYFNDNKYNLFTFVFV